MLRKCSRKLLKKIKFFTAITVVAISIIFIFGCYKNISESDNPYSMSRSDQGPAISKEDLNKFSDSVRIIDGQAESHYKMALYFQQRKKHQFAIDELKIALKLNPIYAKAYNAMGISYDKIYRHNQAISCYQSAIRLDPNLDYVYNNLGYSYLIYNKLDSAIETFQKAIELDGKNKLYRNNLALAYILNDQYDEAYQQFKAIENETEANEKLASILYKLGKVKVQQYFSKDSNSGRNAEELERNKPKIVRKKIHDVVQDSVGKVNTAEQRLEDQSNEDIKFSANYKKALQSNEKETEDGKSLYETNAEQSRVSLTGSSEINDPKNLKSLEIIKKPVDQEFQIELDNSTESVSLESKKANQKVSAEKSSAVVVAYLTAKTSKDKSSEVKPIQKTQISSMADMKLADTKEDLKDTHNITVEVEIEVFNGNGVKRAANKFGKYLISEGFKVTRVANANSFDHETTKILYCNDNITNVDKLLERIPVAQIQRNIIEVKNLGNRIKIIIGKDLIENENVISKAIFSNPI